MKTQIKFLTLLLLIFSSCKNDDNQDEITKEIVADLNTYSISSIIIDNSNTKWIGTETGLFKSVENGYEKQNVTGKILSLYLEKSSGILWIGTDAGLYQGTVKADQITISQITSSNLSNNNVRTVYIDSSSKKWFGTNLNLTMYDGKVWKKEKFLINGLGELSTLDIEKSSINAIAIGNGNYYFATNSYGLYRAYDYNETADAFSGATQWSAPYNGESATDSIFTAIIDSKGNLWFGGTNGVQKHINGNDPKADNDYYIDELPNIRVRAIAEEPNGDIWVGTENGLAVFNGTVWNNISSQLGNKTFVTAIAFSTDGTAIIGTKSGLVEIK